MEQETSNIRPQLLETIRNDFNLNIYEARIWLALLGSGVATAGKLADISQVPRSRCYDILETLEKKGFILMKIGRPIKYIAVPPEEVMNRVEKSIMSDHEGNMNVLTELKESDIFRELELLYKAGIEPIEVNDLSNTVVGDKNINYFARQMVDKAEQEIHIACGRDSANRIVNSLRSRLLHARKRGVDINLYGPLSESYGKKMKGITLSHADHSMNFVCIDNKELLIYATPSADDPQYEMALWISAPFTVRLFWALFTPFIKSSSLR